MEIPKSFATTITSQMEVLQRKAEQLVQRKEQLVGKSSIPNKREIAQVKDLIGIANRGVSIISAAEMKEINFSSKLECWLESVNAAISQTNDLLDVCQYDEHRHSVAVQENKSNWWSSMSSLSARSNLTNSFKSVNSNLKTALDHLEGEEVSSVPAGAPNQRSAKMQAMKDTSEIESQVVECEEGLKTILERLFNSDKELSFIYLVGWAGTGKTTLARLLYKNPDVMYHFNERMWVQVPEDLGKVSIKRSTSSTLTRTRGEVSTVDEISRSLQERLKGKRYLLVLDDVSEVNSKGFILLTDVLRNLGGSRGCNVVITTSSRPAENDSSFVYPMKLGSSEYCRALFDKILLADGGVEGFQNLGDISGAIVDKCQGNPVYIKMLASLTCRMKVNLSQWWSRIESREEWKDGIPQLCFNYMSSLPLKRCFQYCSIFPKGYLIPREELIQLWMAQGYLDLHSADMAALGDHYYDILLRSCFLQAAADNDFDPQSCKLPDDLRGVELFTEKSSDCFKTLENDEEVKDCSEAVHLSLIHCKVKVSKSLRGSFSKLRTLRLENTGGLGELLKYAECLRVLIVVDGSLEELPSSIGNLTCLKYLDISRTKIVKLPDSISKLYNLQTLRLYDLRSLPTNFDHLNLRHLCIQNLKDLSQLTTLPPKFQGLLRPSAAQASYKVSLDKEGKIDVWELRNVLNLCSSISIRRLENITGPVEAPNAGLSKVQRMESLTLNWSARRENSRDEEVLESLQPHTNVQSITIENFKGATFPSWMKVESIVLHKLVKMELYNCSWCDELPQVGGLPCLRILRIGRMDSVNHIAQAFYGLKSDSDVASSDIFPALKEFSLYGMSNLERWSGPSNNAEVTAFPSLVSLEVEQCPMLTSIPDIIAHVDRNQRMCLRKVKIAHSEKLASLPGKLEEHLGSLEDLELYGLPSLGKLCIERETKLKSLMIGCLAERAEAQLAQQLQHLSTLTNLTIWGYGELKKLPDCVADLPLQVLKLESCGKLMEFPAAEKMQQLINKSLKELHICYCPQLEHRCTRGSRPEWRKISRIPTILVNKERIQPADHDGKKRKSALL